MKLIRIEEITLNLQNEQEILVNKISKILNIDPKEIKEYSIVKKSIDSRDKSQILFVYSVNVELKKKYKINYFNKELKRHNVRLIDPYIYKIDKIDLKDNKKPVIVGSGPCGLFCGLVLANAGLKPLIIERGKDVDSRIEDVDLFLSKRELDPNSNVQFGEGGAGTFSDGKLYTLINNPRTKYIFDEFIEAGAPKEIAFDSKPHIGTDNLRVVVKNIREKIIKLGGEIKFETCLTDIKVKKEQIEKITVNKKEKIEVDNLVLAIGHSARDTYEMLFDKKIKMDQKSFSMGLRIEHEAEMINKSQYGVSYNHPKLTNAKYNLAAHLKNNRSVYTFCMCPGGYVTNASSEKEMLTTNGMSEYKQDGKNSNSALLVNITPADFNSDHPLAGIEFQRKWEHEAFLAGGSNYNAPSQLVKDFLNDEPSSTDKKIKPSFKPGVTFTTLNNCLPDYIIESIKEALPLFDKKIKGFANDEAILTGIEARSSSPVRICRDEDFQSNILGIYPAGEGAGYAGGITSSAIDGMVIAEKIIKKYQ